ncbi:MAG TPA: uracil-DNA glycosylase [Methylophilaceae bacterium]|nr:uracil-DNA glycosylase [Methylophilaceae bacterium]
MAIKREDLLRELELLPVWQQRPASGEPEAVVKPSPMYEPAPKAEAGPATMQERDEEYVAEPAAESVLNSTSEEPAVMLEEMDPPDELPPAEKDEPSALLSPSGEDRQQIIMQMGWSALEQAVEHCPACNLCNTRTKTVFGVGDRNADWMFVGEAPGAEEDRKGEPFVGQAGKLLDNMLAAIKLRRGNNVYIANVLKCRPPDNRDPHGEEVAQCNPYLLRQVELIKPKLIVALGKFAAQSLLNSNSAIAAMRGKLHDYNGVPVIVTYHPAYLLRNMSDKAKAWEDLCFAVKIMQGL